MNEGLRRSGRTTRMLQEAIDYAKKGRAVYVIAATHNHAQNLERTLHYYFNITEDLGIKFETFDSLRTFDEQAFILHGAHPNCVVLIDHYAIERKYYKILEMLHRYDKKEEEKT